MVIPWSIIFLLSQQRMITEVPILPRSERIEKILGVEDENIEGIAKSRVQEMLAEDADFLLEKRKREIEKKQRVKQMEQTLEIQRANKLQKITQKKIKSNVLVSKNKQLMSKRFRQKSEHYKSVISKIQHANEQQIEKALRQRESFFQTNPNSRNNKSLSRSLKDQTIHSKTEDIRGRSIDIDYQISQINDKAKKAQLQHEMQQRQAMERAREAAKHVQEIQKKAFVLSSRQESEAFKNYYEKSQEMEKIYRRAKSQNDKKIVEKRKCFKDKLDKCTENLRQLSYIEEQKLGQLQKKFDRKYEPKQWRDVRLQKYKQKWQENSKKIEQEKQCKAQRILQKHEQITQQNRTYKDRRDKLLQAVKYAEI